MNNETKELKDLNDNARLLLSKYDGVFTKLEKEKTLLLKQVADKSGDGVEAIKKLLDHGTVAQAENANKLGGKVLDEVIKEVDKKIITEIKNENTTFLWSGGNNNTHHANSETWYWMNMNYDAWKNSRFDDFLEKVTSGQYGFKIKKAGYYQMSGEVLQHSNSYSATKHTLLQINSNHIHYAHSKGHGWNQTMVNGVAWFNVGDIMKLRCYVSQNNNSYQWHEADGSKHTCLNVQYLGGKR